MWWRWMWWKAVKDEKVIEVVKESIREGGEGVDNGGG